MQSNKSAIILEAQWMESEIPRIEQELARHKQQEQELLNSAIETVRQAYTETYRAQRKQARYFYHRQRAVTPTRYGYRERMIDAGWFSLSARLLITAAVAFGTYVVYHNHQLERTQRGVIWGSVLFILAIGLAFLPPLADHLWERVARKKAQEAADDARLTEDFAREKAERQTQLTYCRERIAEQEERLDKALTRLDELRRSLIGTNHQDSEPTL